MAKKGEQGGNPRAERKQPVGGGKISREEESSSRVGGEGHVSQQSNADADGPSQQTSTAQDEMGQV
jgi:hypothetical protein